jgi:hypothetical protein
VLYGLWYPTTIFNNIYPIYDQIDVLLSNLIFKLNIYNIKDVVYQKQISTNTQNNLHVIFHSPNYVNVKDNIYVVKNLIYDIANLILIENQKNNENISLHLLFDVVLNNITNHTYNGDLDKVATSDYVDLDKESKIILFKNTNKNIYDKIYFALYYILKCCIKADNIEHITDGMINIILYTLYNFNNHNKYNKSYDFGTTSNVYLNMDGYIIKQYNKKMRSKTKNHDNIEFIYKKELKFLKKQNQRNVQLVNYDNNYLSFKLTYSGESLYQNFTLPDNYKEQLFDIFTDFTKNKIYYSEFRLENITVLKNKISLIDFGMAEDLTEKNNAENYELFCKLLDLLNEKFKTIDDIYDKHILYNKLILSRK